MNRPVFWLAIVTTAAAAGWWANEALRRLEHRILHAPSISHGRLHP